MRDNKEIILEYLMKLANKKGVNINEDTDLFEAGILDSLGIIMLISYLQEELGVEFEVEDLKADNYKSFKCISKWIDSL